MLAQVILPQFCKSIGRFAFEDCKQLVGIDIPDTVTFIGPAAFRGCPLRSLKIPKNVTEIECCLCQDCCSLERVDFPETLTAIGAASYICLKVMKYIFCSSFFSVPLVNPQKWRSDESIGNINFPHLGYLWGRFVSSNFAEKIAGIFWGLFIPQTRADSSLCDSNWWLRLPRHCYRKCLCAPLGCSRSSLSS